MTSYVFDIEANGLLHEVDKVHCIVVKKLGADCWNEFTEYNFDEVIHFFNPTSHDTPLTLIGHNILDYDMEILRRFFNVNFSVMSDTILGKPVTFIDTLSWSRRLWPDRPLPKGCPKKHSGNNIGPHSIAAWAYRVTGKKPEVEDWKDQPLRVYLDRCYEDVKIQEQVYYKLLEEARQ